MFEGREKEVREPWRAAKLNPPDLGDPGDTRVTGIGSLFGRPIKVLEHRRHTDVLDQSRRN